MNVNELRKFNAAWTDFALAFQELCDSFRMLYKEQVHVKYWVCLQTPDHVWDYDEPRVAMVPNQNWRTHGKSLCPSCGGILAERIAKVGK